MNTSVGYLLENTSWYQLLLLLSGMVFLYTAFLIYEDEEGKMQNRLEVWWCRLDDAANKALNIHLRIIQRFAKHAKNHTDSMFGKDLISYQSVGVSICWGIISAKLTVVILGLTTSSPPIFIIIGQLIGCLLIWIVSKRPGLFSRNHRAWLAFVLILWIVITLSAYYSGNLGNKLNPLPPSDPEPNVKIVRLGLAVIPLYIWGVLLSIPVCIIFIGVLRLTLNLITRSKSNIRVLGATALQCSFLVPLILLHLITFRTLKSDADFRQYIFQIVTPVMGYAYEITIILILMLLHIVFWGTMQRPIYFLARLGIERRKKLFAGLGALLIYLAFPSAMEQAKTLGLEFIKSVMG